MNFKVKIISLITIIFFIIYITPTKNFAGGDIVSYKKYALPLLGVSILAGIGASYLRETALKKYAEAEELWQEYMALKSGTNEDFESAYERYEDKYAEAVQYRNYYLICGGVGILTAVAGIFLLVYSPSNKSISIGYRSDFIRMQNDFYVKIRF